MSRPFARHRDRIRVRLSARETRLLRDLPLLLESAGGDGDEAAAARLAPPVYLSDADADAEWRRFMQPELDQGREADRSVFGKTLGRGELTAEEAEGWLRTIGEARLVLGARLGITEDGWSADEPAPDPMLALLHYLSWLQEELVAALTGVLPAAP